MICIFSRYIHTQIYVYEEILISYVGYEGILPLFDVEPVPLREVGLTVDTTSHRMMVVLTLSWTSMELGQCLLDKVIRAML